MRKNTIVKSAAVLILILCTFLAMMPMQTRAEYTSSGSAAATDVQYAKKIGLCMDEPSYWVLMGNKVKKAKKVTVKSSKKSVVSARVASKGEGKYKNSIILEPKKKGSSVITVKVTKKNGKKKTYRIKVTSYKYSNPAAAFMIAGESFSFDKDNYVSWMPKVTKGKISVKAKSGWKVKKIVSWAKDSLEEKAVKNGASVNLDPSSIGGYTVYFYNAKKKLTLHTSVALEEPDTMEDEEPEESLEKTMAEDMATAAK